MIAFPWTTDLCFLCSFGWVRKTKHLIDHYNGSFGRKEDPLGHFLYLGLFTKFQTMSKLIIWQYRLLLANVLLGSEHWQVYWSLLQILPRRVVVVIRITLSGACYFCDSSSTIWVSHLEVLALCMIAVWFHCCSDKVWGQGFQHQNQAFKSTRSNVWRWSLMSQMIY